MARRAQSRWRSRFPANWEGFDAFREETGAKLAKTSKTKYKPIIERAEELRVEMFDDDAWGDIDPEDIAFDLVPTIYGEVKSRGGGKPSTNTLRGWQLVAYEADLTRKPPEFEQLSLEETNWREDQQARICALRWKRFLRTRTFLCGAATITWRSTAHVNGCRWDAVSPTRQPSTRSLSI